MDNSKNIECRQVWHCDGYTCVLGTKCYVRENVCSITSHEECG